MITIESIQHPTQDMQVEQVRLETREDLEELRASGWHDGQLRLLRMKSSTVGFLGTEAPLFFGGLRVEVPCVVLKGPAGDFEVHQGGVIVR